MKFVFAMSLRNLRSLANGLSATLTACTVTGSPAAASPSDSPAELPVVPQAI
jgi:hypothetical protein